MYFYQTRDIVGENLLAEDISELKLCAVRAIPFRAIAPGPNVPPELSVFKGALGQRIYLGRQGSSLHGSSSLGLRYGSHSPSSTLSKVSCQ